MEDYIDSEMTNPIIQEDGLGETYNEYDLNGDGNPDVITYEEDTNGDGLADYRVSVMDEDLDGYMETYVVETDQNNDGYMETVEASIDIDADGQVDALYSSVDINGDGIEDVVEINQDTNGSGVMDTTVYTEDLDSDGIAEFVKRENDYNEDGNADSMRIYQDNDKDGSYETIAEVYDSDNDFVIDRADIHHDYDNDGKVDFTEEYAYDPASGNLTQLNDTPSYAQGIEGTYHYELNQYEPSPDYPAGISGDPSSSMEQWEYQGDTGRCALYSQKFIIEEFTGQEIDIEELVKLAEENGWFSDDSGTTFLNTNKILDAYGIENEMSFHNDISDIDNCLKNGGRVVVAIDADEIWYGEGDDLFSPNSSPNHAVEVIGIDYSDPNNPMVILNDSGTPNGRGEMVPLDDFMDAWQDSECQMIACYPNN